MPLSHEIQRINYYSAPRLDMVVSKIDDLWQATCGQHRAIGITEQDAIGNLMINLIEVGYIRTTKTEEPE